MYSGRARDVPLHVDFVYERAPKAASLGSCEIYSLAWRGRMIGLQCMTLFMLKQVCSASYMVSGISHTLLLASSGYGLWGLYSLVSLVCVWVGSIVVCLCVRLAIAPGSDVLLSFASGLLFRGGRGGPYFLSCGCFVVVVGIYSLFAIGGGEYL